MYKLVQEYRGYQIHSYKARSNYGHYRISKVVRPCGNLMDGLTCRFKFWSGEEGNEHLRNTNIGPSHKSCLEYMKSYIDLEMADGTLPETGN